MIYSPVSPTSNITRQLGAWTSKSLGVSDNWVKLPTRRLGPGVAIPYLFGGLKSAKAGKVILVKAVHMNPTGRIDRAIDLLRFGNLRGS